MARKPASANVQSPSEYDIEEEKRAEKYGPRYKWVALSNTTLGALMSSINGTILIISLPALFNGLGVNPLVPANVGILLWLLLGYSVVSGVIVVTIGRMSDMFGRVRLYNIGFLIFTLGSVFLYVSSLYIYGTVGALALVFLRLFQAVGGAFLFANSVAILIDAFPPDERGKAIGFNQIAGVGGSILGFILGGVLSAVDWHYIFLVNVPIGIIGTIWAYVALHEIAFIKKGQGFDILGNVSFAIGLVLILIALTYALLPYGTNLMGRSNPYVLTSLGIGLALLAVFGAVELRAKFPMFRLSLFRIRAFAAGNISLLLAGIARGGLQFMIIIWLQGIWLPLHGVAFENTPLQSAILMIPMLAGFILLGPVAGYLSDRYGARLFSTTGMLINVVGFLLLAAVPTNFNYTYFAALLFLMGVGQGMFAAPNTTAIMNAVPPEHRGVASGMRATFTNVSMVFSIAIFFTLLIAGISITLPHALYSSLISQQMPASEAARIASLPPTSALFAALLGYNPLKSLANSTILAQMPQANATNITGNEFFPNILASPFNKGMENVLYIGAAIAAVAAITSALRGKRYIHTSDEQS